MCDENVNFSTLRERVLKIIFVLVEIRKILLVEFCNIRYTGLRKAVGHYVAYFSIGRIRICGTYLHFG